MIIHGLRQIWRRRRPFDGYVHYPLAPIYPAFREKKRPFWRRWLQPEGPSLQSVAADFRRLAADPRVKGVVLTYEELRPVWSRLDFIRREIRGLRDAGKTVVIWAKDLDLAGLYLNGAAAATYLQPGAFTAALGISRRFLFFKDALNKWGLQFEAVAISPFKSAADMFTRSDMSPEVEQMANWLLDSEYGYVVNSIADDRGLAPEAVRQWCDSSPYSDGEVLDKGMVQGICSFEELPGILGSPILSWSSVQKRLLLEPRPQGKAYVAVVPVQGDIVDGESAEPPLQPPFAIPLVSRRRAGDRTVVQQIRRAEKDKRAKALLFFVNSGGGSASASEAMHNALQKAAAKKPVIVYMDAVAASGGYYISVPARYILAHPTTLTGSIGVLSGQFSPLDWMQRQGIAQQRVFRGSELQPDLGPLTALQQKALRSFIERIYALFLQRVSAGRSLTPEQVDQVGGGRVWTGSQALEHGLVDGLGTLSEALEKAAALGELPRPQLRIMAPGAAFSAPLPAAGAMIDFVRSGIFSGRRQPLWLLSPLALDDDGE